MICKANIFKCLIFLGKPFFKETGRTCLFEGAEGWESSFVLLQIFYFSRVLRSISLLQKDTAHAIFPS